MDLADNWLGVPKLLTPEEIINPNVDEQSMMTYLSQFPNAKVKEGAPFREKALASKVRAHGPGNLALFQIIVGSVRSSSSGNSVCLSVTVIVCLELSIFFFLA